MKIKISFLLTTVLFLVLTTSVLATSTDFFTKAQKYIDSNCPKQKISNEVALFCYLFAKSSEQENRIDELEQRVEDLENIITASPSPAPQTSYIVSDATWKFSNIEVGGWLNASFDDSSWINSQAPSAGQCPSSAIVGNHLIENGVLPMSVSSPNWAGSSGYFRKTFNLSSIPSSSTARIVFDDDGDLYLNGHLLISNLDGTTDGIHETNVDVAYFMTGINVINAKIIDSNGGCQWGEVELTINQ